ncbi:MAG: T9SS type A sorting domain-containing protein [Flavobacteriales bacterium]|nr:T9SS type A sorting domain-containing protein [Flavobacteriales bacterium]MCB9173269.1 T9SS type A sorting domain-containing protein [Flavobacteriales bacterium]
MKTIYTILAALIITSSIKAQAVYDSTSMGALYPNQVFYSLDNGEVANIDNNNWDIAFSASGAGAAGSAILLNEATSTLWAYPGDTSAWSTFDTTNYASWQRLLNTDTTWTNGAFNLYRGANGTFDMGWGILNPTNNFWTFGDSLYLIKLSDNSFRKLWILSLKSGVWAFKYANIDGSNEQIITITKSTYPNKNFIYHSILNNQTIDREPVNSSWDLTFVKHTDYVNPPGTYVSVTSVFSNKNVWSAKAHEVDSATAAVSTTPQTAFTQNISNIGREWKRYISAQAFWNVYDSVAYFVYDNDSTNFYRIQFTAFGGMGNGKTFFYKELLNNVGIADENVQATFALYPNPVKNNLTLLLNSNKSELLDIDIYSINGVLVAQQRLNASSGTQQLNINTSDLSNGFYVVNIKSESYNLSQKFIKQ